MLALKDVKVAYGAIRILNGIDMNVERGSIVAVLGGNGAGKSTLLKAISGLIHASSGQILFDGEDITQMRPDKIVRRGLVQVPQGKEAFPSMTVEENLLIGSHIVTGRRQADNLERIYSFFPTLKEFRKQYAAYLSGGQRQMLCIGRGLMSNPRMLLLDEPSAALAPLVVLDIFKTISRISREGLTVLIVEQNVRMALLLASYGYVIRDGVVHLQDESRRLISDQRVRESYLGGTLSDFRA